eukprot:TRINITY_DN56446_c0_g1_i1.p1 TRINITY_DN56446_c0_g1~~TRINITY_DN56446_c0_g1_i1.p1  ORF type:complete len:459 (-),score=77.81 TRINITY_DN56446_c0_g1_i1:75-1451(-)
MGSASSVSGASTLASPRDNFPPPFEDADSKSIPDDLRAHGYEPLKHFQSSCCSRVVLVRRLRRTEGFCVAKVFAPCSRSELHGQGDGKEEGPLQEVFLLRSLQHPHVVKYVETWCVDMQQNLRRLTLVMEHADDGDLHGPRQAMVDIGAHFEEGLILRWLRQMLSALSYIHSRGVVHRDLKTSNVFLTESWTRILVGDFGISSILASTRFSKASAGTPAYMAPETVRAERYCTAVDMWAVGIILYELLALTLPFSGSLLSLVYQINFVAVKDEPLLDAGYSKLLVCVVTSLLAKDTSARPTAADLLDREVLWTAESEMNSEVLASEACCRNRRRNLKRVVRELGADGMQTRTGTCLDEVGFGLSVSSWAMASTNPDPFAEAAGLNDCEDVTRGTDCKEHLSDVSIVDPFSNLPSPTEKANEQLRGALQDASASGKALSLHQLEVLLARLRGVDKVGMT